MISFNNLYRIKKFYTENISIISTSFIYCMYTYSLKYNKIINVNERKFVYNDNYFKFPSASVKKILVISCNPDKRAKLKFMT